MKNRSGSFSFAIILLFALTIVSCRESKRISLSELKAYATDPENDLVQTIHHNNFTFEVIHRPKELIVEQMAGIQQGPVWDSMAARLARYDYFVLRMSRNEKEVEASSAGDPASHSTIVNYLNGTIADDISMVVDHETIKAINLVYTPTFGMANASSILITFDSNLMSRKKDFTIVFDDREFKTGRHEFNFDYEAIEAVPELNREGI